MPPTSATGRPRRAGFTLVELLLVLTIISLAAAAVVLAAPDPRPSLQREAERLAARLAMARDAAIVDNRLYAISIDASGYAFAERRGGQWRDLDQAPFSKQAWEGDTRPDLEEGEARATLDPTGLADPLELTLQRNEDRRIVRLSAAGEVAVAAE